MQNTMKLKKRESFPADKEPVRKRGILMPVDYSFEALNAFVNHPDVGFEELQWALLSCPQSAKQKSASKKRRKAKAQQL